MTLPEYQSYALHTTGHGYYRVAWRDAPSRDDRVVLMGLPCRVVAVVHERDGWSKVCVTTDRRSLT